MKPTNRNLTEALAWALSQLTTPPDLGPRGYTGREISEWHRRLAECRGMVGRARKMVGGKRRCDLP